MAILTSEYEVQVRYAETDQMGVVYHANYLIWCEVGRTDLIRKQGRSYADIERLGVGLAVSEATLRFLAPARYDDRITVTTSLVDVRSRALTFEYVIANAETGQTLVTASTKLIGLAQGGTIARLPKALLELLGAPTAR